MHPIRTLRIKAGYKQKQKQQKPYKLMETGQISTEWKMSQDRNKEIKDFLEFNENEYTASLDLWSTVKEKWSWKESS